MDLLLVLDVGATLWRGWGNGAFERWVDLPGGGAFLQSVATFGDFDGDGHHDLYLSRMSVSDDEHGSGFVEFEEGYCPTIEELEGHVNHDTPATDILVLRRGDGWEDATDRLGLGAPSYTQAAMVADLDGDFRLDLLVGTEGIREDYAYFGAGSEVAMSERGVSGGMDELTSAMGYDAVDIDRDGDLDLYVTDILGGAGDKVYVQENDGWRLATSELGFDKTKEGTGWGVGFADFDHDADLDAFVVNGQPGLDGCPGGEQENYYFVNAGGTYSWFEPPKGSGLDAVENSRAAVFSDIDNDGDLDALVSNVAGAPQLLRNDMASGGWLKVFLRHPTLRPVVGARLELTVDGVVLRRDVHGTPSYGGTSTEDIHFGLGEATGGMLVVWWPDGSKTDVGAVQANTRVIVEP